MNAECAQRILDSLLIQLKTTSKAIQSMQDYIKSADTEEIKKERCKQLEECVYKMLSLAGEMYTTLLNFDCLDLGKEK